MNLSTILEEYKTYRNNQDKTIDDFLDEIIPPFYNSRCDEKTRLYFCNHIFSTKIDENITILNQMRDNCLQTIKKDLPEKQMKKLTHKIWLTKKEDGHLPNQAMIDILKNHYSELIDFKHYLWCNNTKIGKQIIDLMEIDGLDIELHEICELENCKGSEMFNICLKNNLFANACDIARIQVVYKYGGIYSDFGWGMTKYISTYLKNFDIMFNGENAEWCKGYISHNVIYSKKPDHIIFSEMLSYLENKKFLIDFNKEGNLFCMIEIVSPRFIMTSIPALCKNDKLITLENNVFTFGRHHNFSHTNGLYGSRKTNGNMEDINTEINNYINNL